MTIQTMSTEKERKLKALDLKIRIRKFKRLKEELSRVKEALLLDIETIEAYGDDFLKEFVSIKKDLFES
jgi:hypothetical protein